MFTVVAIDGGVVSGNDSRDAKPVADLDGQKSSAHYNGHVFHGSWRLPVCQSRVLQRTKGKDALPVFGWRLCASCARSSSADCPCCRVYGRALADPQAKPRNVPGAWRDSSLDWLCGL